MLICDNLDAHCFRDVLEIFAEGNILVWFCVPGCTDLIQPIDAGIGRSVRILVGHALDRWLSVDKNLNQWEGSLSTRERRILMSNFLADAMIKMLSAEKKNVRVGSFERTGCLMQLYNRELGDGKYTDDVIQPQGLEGKYTIPVVTAVPGPDIPLDNTPDETEDPAAIDADVGHENDDLLNDLFETDDNRESLFPEGIDIGDESESRSD